MIGTMITVSLIALPHFTSWLLVRNGLHCLLEIRHLLFYSSLSSSLIFLSFFPTFNLLAVYDTTITVPLQSKIQNAAEDIHRGDTCIHPDYLFRHTNILLRPIV